MSEENPKIAVLGLGAGGIKILNALAVLPAASKLTMVAIDTDAVTLNTCRVPEANRILADVQWQQGRGCGGDPLKGQRSIARERENIEPRLAGFDYAILIGGLGGGLATGAMVALSTLSSRLKLPTVHLLTLPFSWEGDAKRQRAEAALAELRPVSDVLLTLPNDLLFSVLLPETPADDAFRLADAEVARAAVAIAELLTCRSLIPVDFADLQGVLKSRKCYCSIGVGVASVAEGGNPGQLAVDRMLAAPLLGGTGKLKEADAVLFSVLGGPEFSIANLTQTTQAAAQCFGEHTEVITGITTSDEFKGCVMAAAVAVRYSDRAQLKPKTKQPSLVEVELSPGEPAAAGEPQQLEFELVQRTISRGIFANSVQISFNGEDLDLPTFARRDVQIDRGE
ncbi:MAG: hypothetical protein AB7F40_04750 [Victivallaceae bacterium]|nr:hypothetical protein [Victivallaceae bacterium]